MLSSQILTVNPEPRRYLDFRPSLGQSALSDANARRSKSSQRASMSFAEKTGFVIPRYLSVYIGLYLSSSRSLLKKEYLKDCLYKSLRYPHFYSSVIMSYFCGHAAMQLIFYLTFSEHYSFARAWSKSFNRSAVSSNPADKRICPIVIPMAASSSAFRSLCEAFGG